MTAAEYEGTDFYEMTDKALVDYIESAGEAYQLSRKYRIEIKENGETIQVKNLTVNIDPTTFLFAHRDIYKDRQTDGYRFKR